MGTMRGLGDTASAGVRQGKERAVAENRGTQRKWGGGRGKVRVRRVIGWRGGGDAETWVRWGEDREMGEANGVSWEVSATQK